ncbi:myosin heavy chain, clone 203-like [Montipora capricornis]|uniref:myosin heavy chain, clone 203-like n=1 Tax=Montipora capricornis TaxID=246305 RepID=UPI0035F1E812
MSQSAWNRNYPVSEADLYGLPDDIGSHKWKDLARALGFHRASIEAIQQEKGNSKECCIEILVRWLRQNGAGATAGKLAEALTKIGLKNLADRFPIKPSDTNRNDKIEETVREFCEELMSFLKKEDSMEKNKARELEDTVSKISNRIKELEEEVSRLETRNDKLQDGEKQKMEDLDARERRIRAKLQKCSNQLETNVTSTLLEVKQDQLKTPVKLEILKILSEDLEDLYIAALDIVSQTCKCTGNLKREFCDFAYHGLWTNHYELVHRVEDLEDTVQEMSEKEKEELRKLKELQVNRQSLEIELEEKWRAVISPPEQLPKNRRTADISGRGERSTDNKKVKRNTDPGARPKQRNVRDKRLQSPKHLSRAKKALRRLRFGTFHYQRLKES